VGSSSSDESRLRGGFPAAKRAVTRRQGAETSWPEGRGLSFRLPLPTTDQARHLAGRNRRGGRAANRDRGRRRDHGQAEV